MYGSPSDKITRHALHAESLTFPRPADGKVVTVRAPLHEDMQALALSLFPRFFEHNKF